jgi:hypothetical protein
MKRILAILFVAFLPALASAQTYTIAPPPFLTEFDNSGKFVNNGCIWTYLAGTTTAAPTYQTASGTPNGNPIRTDSAGRFTAFLSPGTLYKFQYEGSCTPPSHGVTYRTADNIGAIPPVAANVDIVGVAGENLATGDCAYISNGVAPGSTPGYWYRCHNGQVYSSSNAPQIGMVPTAFNAGVSGSIRIAGRMTGLSVSAGSTYYVGPSSGAISTTITANRRQVGIADSATSILIYSLPTGVAYDGSIVGPLKGYGETWQSLAIVSNVVSWDFMQGQHIIVTLNANITSFTISHLPPNGVVAAFIAVFIGDGTPGRTITHTINSGGGGVAVRFPGAVAPTMTTTLSRLDKILYTTFDGGLNWTGEIIAQNE